MKYKTFFEIGKGNVFLVFVIQMGFASKTGIFIYYIMYFSWCITH